MKGFLVIVLPLFLVSSAFSQYGTQQEEAMRLFNEGNYKDAYAQFKRLIVLFPKDPRYFYYAGICAVNTNTDLPKSIDYLNFASNKDVPRDVYFYLGKAYHLQYKFDDAIGAYLKFQQFGDRKSKEKLEVDMNLQMARNGITLISNKVDFSVYKADSINLNSIFDYYNHLLTNGKFQQKTEQLLSFKEREYKSWRYIPLLLQPGQTIYESGFSTGRKQRDLFYTKRNDDGTYTNPSSLGNIINSDFDEEYAYFNDADATLYFASKGHNSMGGYDLFKSHYNADTKTWSEPENLGFPINSPYDDILFVPSDDQKTAVFASNRATNGELFKIYKIDYSTDYPQTKIAADQDLNAIADLRKNAIEKPQPAPKKQKTITEEKSPNPSNNRKTYPEELVTHNEYNVWINSALKYQLQSDSCFRAIDDLQQKLIATKNENEKSKIKTTIAGLDNKARAAQTKADAYFAKARDYENQVSAQRNDSSPHITDEMAKKAFSQSNSSSKKDERKQKENEQIKPVIYEFKILNKSPYKSLSDIPLDIELPGGIIYKIQMGAFSKPILPDHFKGISPISGESIRNGEITKYYAGLFNRMADAEKALNKIKENGFKDAFIVSYFNGKNIPVNRANEIEKDN